MDILFILIVIFFIIFAIWLSSCLFGAPFQSSTNKELREIVELAKAKRGDKIVDLGSGNGKIVIEFAKQGIESHGYEINPLLVWLSRKRIKKWICKIKLLFILEIS